jgi:hypothetical protein
MCTVAADKEFDELCFDFGIELDDVVGNNFFSDLMVLLILHNCSGKFRVAGSLTYALGFLRQLRRR